MFDITAPCGVFKTNVCPVLVKVGKLTTPATAILAGKFGAAVVDVNTKKLSA